MKRQESKETKERGTKDFPLGFYHVDISHPRYNMPFHWHIEPELIRVVQGCLILKLEDKTIRLEKNDLAFFHTYGRIETVLLIDGVDLAVIKNSVHYILLLGSRPAASGRAGSRIRSFQPEPAKMLSGHKFLQTVRSRRRSQEHA